MLEVGEAVPFRLTPNLQHFITPVGLDGIYTASLMAIARSLADPDVRGPASRFARAAAHVGRVPSGPDLVNDGVPFVACVCAGSVAVQLQLGELLNVFIRDEVMTWLATTPQRPGLPQSEPSLRERVMNNVELVLVRVRTLACLPQGDRVRDPILGGLSADVAATLTRMRSGACAAGVGGGADVAAGHGGGTARASADSAPHDGSDEPAAAEPDGPHVAPVALSEPGTATTEKKMRLACCYAHVHPSFVHLSPPPTAGLACLARTCPMSRVGARVDQQSLCFRSRVGTHSTHNSGRSREGRRPRLVQGVGPLCLEGGCQVLGRCP